MKDQYLILVADDEEIVREMLEDTLKEEGYRVATAKDGKEALEKIDSLAPDAVLLDNRMPEMSGVEVLEFIRRAGAGVPVILMTAYGSTEVTIQATKLGAFDYIVKPFQVRDLLSILERATAMRRLSSQVEALRKELSQNLSGAVLIGQSAQMQEVYKTIGRVADTDVTVLLQGESGTGKEMVARAIHLNSSRQDQPFIKINCASIPENLLESELFGHERGSFTGATSRRLGKFEIANRGTIFLDEIGETTLNTQAKLLRVLQDKEYERVGGNETIRVDVRILAATNKDLKKAVAEGTFREDLFFRLNVVTIWVPPLRERTEDIPELVNYFLARYSRQFNKHVQGISREALDLLKKYHWPGNVRELQNVCERAVVMATGTVITPEDIPFPLKAAGQGLAPAPAKGMSLKEILLEMEKQVILNALKENNWNRTVTAQQLGISRRTLYDKIKQHRLDGQD